MTFKQKSSSSPARGAGCARRVLGFLLRRGERCAGCATRRSHQVISELIRVGGKALAVPADVTRYEEVKRVVDAAAQAYGDVIYWPPGLDLAIFYCHDGQ